MCSRTRAQYAEPFTSERHTQHHKGFPCAACAHRRSPSPRYAVDGQIRLFLWLRSLLSVQWLGDQCFDWLVPRLLRMALGDAKKRVEAFEAKRGSKAKGKAQ